MSKSLSDKLPYWHFEEDLMVYSDGSLGTGFQIEGVDINCSTVDKKNQFSLQIESLINSLPENVNLQIFYKLSSKIRDIIYNHKSTSKNQCKNYQDILNCRVNFHITNEENGHYYLPEIYIYLKGTSGHQSRQEMFQSQKDFFQMSIKEFNSHRLNFLKIARQTESSLLQSGLAPQRIKKEKFFEEIFTYLNMSRSEKIGVPTLKEEDGLMCSPLSEQLILNDLRVHKDHLEIGDYLFKVITLKTLPEGQTYSTMVNDFLKLPFHFWLSQNITVHDQKKEIEKLQVQRRLANSMASGAKNVSDLESESKLYDIEGLIGELIESSEKIVSSDFNIVVWGNSKEEVDDKSDFVLKAFKNMNQCEGIIETFPCLDAFLAAMPGSHKGFRYKKMKSSNAAHFAPLYGYWKGHSKPVCLLPNRDGALVSIHPFSKELLNWNGLVFGGSGSGKSFIMCQLMLMFHGYNPKIVWLDNGASSQRLVEILGGETIDLNINSNLCLNVFDLPSNKKEPGPSKIKLILGVLETILKEDDKKSLPKRDKALLEEAILKSYKTHSNYPNFSTLKGILKNHIDSTMRSYADSLYSWTGSTPYGRLLDGKTNINLDKDLITIEMKGLDSYPDLQNVFLLLFTDFIKNEASNDMKRPYLLIIDEAWKLFQTQSGSDFVFEAYRTFRKFLGGLICISQTYSDTLANEELRRAIFPNTSFLYILKQQVDDWDDFSKKLNLNTAEIEQIKSLQTVKGQYSEIFFKQGENQSILRLYPDPLSYWICTSDANDKVYIDDMRGKHPELSQLEVLKKISYENEENI